jgi:hypothetical protein
MTCYSMEVVPLITKVPILRNAWLPIITYIVPLQVSHNLSVNPVRSHPKFRLRFAHLFLRQKSL